jgi:hypothetical protein
MSNGLPAQSGSPQTSYGPLAQSPKAGQVWEAVRELPRSGLVTLAPPQSPSGGGPRAVATATPRHGRSDRCRPWRRLSSVYLWGGMGLWELLGSGTGPTVTVSDPQVAIADATVACRTPVRTRPVTTGCPAEPISGPTVPGELTHPGHSAVRELGILGPLVGLLRSTARRRRGHRSARRSATPDGVQPCPTADLYG